MEAIENLLSLARSRDPDDRGRLLDAVVLLCQEQLKTGKPLSDGVRGTLEVIFMSIVADAERDIRKRLSDQLAATEWAPAPLIKLLAFDEIDIASPVIAASPLLDDDDLVRILTATLEHQLAVARRPGLGAPVVEAILESGDEAVLTALAGNDTAEISADAMKRLVDFSRDVAAMRSPLARHPRLSGEMAERLYEWVGQSLRSALASRFRIDEVTLQRSIIEASRKAAHEASRPWTPAPPLHPALAEAERQLIAKLIAADQLKPSYLMRVLREGRVNLFIEALSALGGFESSHIRRAVDSEHPELLALACVAVGIDRSVFPHLLQLLRAANRGRPGGGAEGLRRATGAFGPFNGAAAGSAFKQALSIEAAVSP